MLTPYSQKPNENEGVGGDSSSSEVIDVVTSRSTSITNQVKISPGVILEGTVSGIPAYIGNHSGLTAGSM